MIRFLIGMLAALMLGGTGAAAPPPTFKPEILPASRHPPPPLASLAAQPATFRFTLLPPGEAQKSIPAIWCPYWTTWNTLADLPAPDVPFGLDLRDCASAPPATEEDLSLIARFKNLDTLYLARTRISDKGLKGIAARFPALRNLDLSQTQITDAGLKEVGRLKNLESLGVTLTETTGAGLKE